MRIVILIQENKTPDYYFPTLASWGANIQNRGNLLTTPPMPDPAHDRNAWVHYKMGNYAPTTLQIDNDVVLPFYSWLAKTSTYCDYHFGLGTNSTPGHMLAAAGEHLPAAISFIHTSTSATDDAFTAMATANTLPDLCFVWSPAGFMDCTRPAFK